MRLLFLFSGFGSLYCPGFLAHTVLAGGLFCGLGREGIADAFEEQSCTFVGKSDRRHFVGLAIDCQQCALVCKPVYLEGDCGRRGATEDEAVVDVEAHWFVEGTLVEYEFEGIAFLACRIILVKGPECPHEEEEYGQEQQYHQYERAEQEAVVGSGYLLSHFCAFPAKLGFLAEYSCNFQNYFRKLQFRKQFIIFEI